MRKSISRIGYTCFICEYIRFTVHMHLFYITKTPNYIVTGANFPYLLLCSKFESFVFFVFQVTFENKQTSCLAEAKFFHGISRTLVQMQFPAFTVQCPMFWTWIMLEFVCCRCDVIRRFFNKSITLKRNGLCQNSSYKLSKNNALKTIKLKEIHRT